MTRRVALLRAINVGGHRVRMADLRRIFEALGYADVETYVASGNVIFETANGDESSLERSIERALESELGYPVETFIRSIGELGAIATPDPFHRRDPDGDARSMFVAFLGRPPTREAVARLQALATDDDAFAVVGREAYWLRRGGIGTSTFSAGFLEKTLGMAATLRGLPTLRKIVARYG